MPPQIAPAPPAPQAPPQAAPASGGLDPKIVNLAKAIRQTESQGNFTAKGASGEYGAYQFLPSTWAGTAPKYGVNVPLNQATPEQQNEVAYKQLADWAKQNPTWNVGNFASAWNAGPGKPNAYLENNVGVNSKGVKYDTPTYAKNVATAYQQIKAQGQTQPQQQDQTEAPAAPTVPGSIQGGGLVGNAINSVAAFGRGLGKEAIKEPIQLGAAIEGGLDKLFGTNTAAGPKAFAAQPALQPQGLGEKVGSVALQGAEFLAPTEGLDVAKGAIDAGKLAGPGLLKGAARIGAKAAVEGGVGGTITGLQTGSAKQGLQAAPLFGALEAATPLAGAALRGVGSLAAHGLGASTGVGADVIKTGYNAAKEGGEATAAYTAALRKQTSPEDIVRSARAALGDMVKGRSEAYNTGLKKIEDETFTTKAGQTYVKKFDPELGKTLFVPTDLSTKGVKDVATRTLKSIGLDAKGRTIDFAGRPSLDSKTIQKIHDFVYDWKDMTPTGLNQLRQEVEGFKKGGIQLSPSDNRFNTYVNSLASNLRNYLGDRVPQVAEMNKTYAQQTGLINDIARNLSLNKRAQSDTAFRKLTSVLRTNNEFRQQLLGQLEDEANRNLPQQIAGQQLSEILPRGIARGLDTVAGLGGLVAGVQVLPLLSAAITTSPRAVGEMLLGLGFTARNANAFARAIGGRSLLFPVVGTTNAAIKQK